MNARLAVALSAFLGATGVAAGAIGAHFIKGRLAAEQFEHFVTANTYQMYHALALLALAGLLLHGKGICTTLAGWAFVLGTLLFSGSLYAYVLTGSTIKLFVMITPFGGSLLIIGWATLLGHACCCWHRGEERE
jgi:uncharacterized membrane protein YgdD (TMEM256/DUF423 family)